MSLSDRLVRDLQPMREEIRLHTPSLFDIVDVDEPEPLEWVCGRLELFFGKKEWKERSRLLGLEREGALLRKKQPVDGIIV